MMFVLSVTLFIDFRYVLLGRNNVEKHIRHNSKENILHILKHAEADLK